MFTSKAPAAPPSLLSAPSRAFSNAPSPATSPTPPPVSDPPRDEAWVLSNPAVAEDKLHAALTLRALNWLDILQQDQRDPAGKPLYDLDLQVQMFKTISEWLKTSKRTKGKSDDDDAVPGIDQMRQIISEAPSAKKRRGAPPGGWHPKIPAAVEDEDSQLAALVERSLHSRELTESFDVD